MYVELINFINFYIIPAPSFTRAHRLPAMSVEQTRNLANLPADIIRRILEECTESLESMRLVRANWRQEITQFDMLDFSSLEYPRPWAHSIRKASSPDRFRVMEHQLRWTSSPQTVVPSQVPKVFGSGRLAIVACWLHRWSEFVCPISLVGYGCRVSPSANEDATSLIPRSLFTIKECAEVDGIGETAVYIFWITESFGLAQVRVHRCGSEQGSSHFWAMLHHRQTRIGYGRSGTRKREDGYGNGDRRCARAQTRHSLPEWFPYNVCYTIHLQSVTLLGLENKQGTCATWSCFRIFAGVEYSYC